MGSDWPLAIFPESSIENIVLGIGEHEIAFLDAGWQKFRETLPVQPAKKEIPLPRRYL